MALANTVRRAWRGGLILLFSIECGSCDPSNTKTYGEDRDAPKAIAKVGDSTTALGTAPATGPANPQDDKELPELTRTRINDLTSIAAALETYRADNGVYPNSGGAYAAYKMSWGKSKGENWIPELVPKYLKQVPRDPTRSEDPDGPQYLYASDGSYFKLIAHYTGDCQDAIKSPRVKRDPVRTNPDGTCWAYGLWSQNGERF